MTVQSDIQKVIASCEAIKGTYSMMAQATENQEVKEMFNGMKSDIDRHLKYLSNRLNYLNQKNQVNQNQLQ